MAQLLDAISALQAEATGTIIENAAQLEQYRLTYLSRNGKLNTLFAEFKQVPAEDKKAVGQALNLLKNALEGKFKEAQEALENAGPSAAASDIDLTLPSIPNTIGGRHPISIVREQINGIFKRLGFNISEGPEIEDDWHNFGALNFPENHPAREMQDTFFIAKDPDFLLRTHTSTVQVRLMEKQQPPIRSIMPGRVYRNEAISARAHCLFHQVEGLYIDKGVSMKDLKQTLYFFVREMFGQDISIRFRPSFFPFTEPSAEMDITCLICKGKGCNICKYSGWVEIGGSGMVHPNVLRASGIDPEVYTGFAFGMGLERMTMLKYGVKDLRLFTENDVRFLKQFRAVV